MWVINGYDKGIIVFSVGFDGSGLIFIFGSFDGCVC